MSSGEGSKSRIESLGREVAPTTAPTAVPAVPSGGWKSEEEEKSKGGGGEGARERERERKKNEMEEGDDVFIYNLGKNYN